jgi:hypothetical protein
MKLGDLKDPIFLIAFKRRVVLSLKYPREKPFTNKKDDLVLRNCGWSLKGQGIFMKWMS